MRVSDVADALETIAPTYLAADWDNVGLLVGDPSSRVRRLLLCIDLTQAVLAEAVASGAQMVMAYHPVIFKPLPRVVAAGSTSLIHQLVRRGLAVYSAHTALDAAPGGTNDVLADLLGLRHRRALEPIIRSGQCKLVVFVPPDAVSGVSDAAFAAGAGRIGDYTHCSFRAGGSGTFYGESGTSPAVGQAGRLEEVEELRLETICPKSHVGKVLHAVRAAHPYEEPAIDVVPLADYPAGCGMGRIGRLSRPVTARTLIQRIKNAVGLEKVLVAAAAEGSTAAKVSLAACAAGSCGPMYRTAAAAGATFYLTGEMRHHDALAASAAGLTVVCLGHSNSERMTLTRLADHLRKMLPKLDTAVAASDRDPFAIV